MRYLIGLGANIGDRAANLAEALVGLARLPGLRLLRASSVYETDPVGFTDQPAFLNMVVEVETDLAPRELLDGLLAIERRLGRVRDVRWGPRVLDLDLLLYDGPPAAEEGLELPHPRAAERQFVLVPMAEIAPDAVLADGRRAAEAARAGEDVRRLGRLAEVLRGELQQRPGPACQTRPGSFGSPGSRPMETPDSSGRWRVSVAIVNWNTRDLLRACLASLALEAEAAALEVIVVDNGSADGSAEMVAAEFPVVRVIRNAANLGFVRATNQGLSAATGDILFSLNSDTQVRAGCVQRLVEVVATHPDIGAVGPRLVNSDGTAQVSVGPFPRLIHRLFPARFEARYVREVEEALSASETGIADVDWVSGAAVLFRRDVLERVGPLDERYFMWYDDLDWCRKLWAAGYRRAIVGDAVVVHHGRQSGRKVHDRDLAEQLFDSEYTYLRLHAGLAATWAVFALRIGKATSRLLLPPRAGRAEAVWRLSYHARRFRRFCLSPMPARGRVLPSHGGRARREEG